MKKNIFVAILQRFEEEHISYRLDFDGITFFSDEDFKKGEKIIEEMKKAAS